MGGRNQDQKLISASTDGRICVWDIKKMDKPTAYYKLQTEARSGNGDEIRASDLSVMGMSKSLEGTDGWYGASDDCALYYVNNTDATEMVSKQTSQVRRPQKERLSRPLKQWLSPLKHVC